jgi:hypothetical protein
MEEVVGGVVADEHADMRREAVRLVAQWLMEADVTALIGAAHGERNPDGRMTQRNGYRRREWDTRAGMIELEIPRLGQGSYFPHGLLEPRTRGEQALLSVVRQAYVCGVSTRRVDQLVESLGPQPIRRSAAGSGALGDQQLQRLLHQWSGFVVQTIGGAPPACVRSPAPTGSTSARSPEAILAQESPRPKAIPEAEGDKALRALVCGLEPVP